MITPRAPASPEDPAAQIARLKRRLAREHQARLAAEAIAESGTLALYRQQERLQLVETIATAANLDDDPEVAFSRALAEICAYTGWPIGHVFMFSEEVPNLLCTSGVWHGADDSALQPFRLATAALTFSPGIGLPGRVLTSRQSVWVEDVTLASNFPRRNAAIASGLHGAFAFPALIGEEVGAVVEFFLRDAAPPDPDLLQLLDRIGAQLGRVVERHRNGRRLRTHNEALSALYAQADAQRHAAEAASRAKSSFLAVTSHEIRTPLNAVLGLSEALRREPLTDRQKDLNDGVLASGKMLLRLLDAVLDLSRIEADQAQVRLEDFDIGAKLRSIISIWTPRAVELGVSLALQDSAISVATIRTDEGRIEQTLVNLISNALKFTPRGGRIEIVATCNGRSLRLEVLDGGSGVAEADRERIFQPFEQTDAGRAAGGAGLGLAICAGNLKLMGGSMGAGRSPDGRSLFWLACPVIAVDSVRAAAVEPVMTGAPTEGLRILAADDNPANLKVLEALLAPAGVILTMAVNGLEAVEALRAGDFDLVLMDANMPIMDGTEAIRSIRREGLCRDTPVHMLTANAFADDVARYLAAGADGVLTKPIQLSELYAVLATSAAQAQAA